ncbi:MAG TPA: DegV family protein [Clostridia bacterium]|jgi:DegV family protein with EDD domain|nr:DegV family protein [Clostridia bacterium]HPY44158.1 DegV family protein [Clostridia bacterium]HQA97103.1 DegV family protein [Clostridia bacterium]
MSFWIVTDVGSDMSLDFYRRYEKLAVLPMPYRVDGVEKLYHVEDEGSLAEFYADLRAEKVATTAQVTVDSAFNKFEELVTQGEDVLYIGLSGGLSGTVQSVQTAREMALEKYPQAKIAVVDSLLASGGQSLIIYYALKLRSEGKSLDETVQWLVNNRQRIISWFTVDDLNFLFRGGRVSRTSALLGSVMRIKPIMHVNYDGKLIPREKITGRKCALKALAEKCITLAKPQSGQMVFISHGDCREEAEYLAGLVREGMKVAGIEFFTLGTIIGAHAGPGTMAIFFLGEGR